MHVIKWQAFRLVTALSTIAAMAIVLEAGRRWG
jgi:hypothetical protein